MAQFVSLDLKHGVKDGSSPRNGGTSAAPVIGQLRVLLHCMMRHAVETDIPARTQFQAGIRRIADSLHDDISAEDLDAAIGKAVQLVEQYNQQASKAFAEQAKELRNLLSSMADTIAFMAGGTDTSVKQLGLVQTKLRQAINLQDPRLMRASMEESLSMVVAEAKRMQSESRAKTEALGVEVERLKTMLTSAKLVASDDATTGLPARASAEQAIEARIAAGKEFTVALFVVDRLVSINGKFGRMVGDQVLVNGALTLAGRLRNATLFRWSGPCFLAVFDESLSAGVAETYAKQAGNFRVEKEFQVGERTAFVVITSTLHLRRVARGTSVTATVDAIDSFLVSGELLDGQ